MNKEAKKTKTTKKAAVKTTAPPVKKAAAKAPAQEEEKPHKSPVLDGFNDKIQSFKTIDDFEETMKAIHEKNLKVVSRGKHLPAKLVKLTESRRDKKLVVAIMELSDGSRSKAGLDIFGRYFEVVR